MNIIYTPDKDVVFREWPSDTPPDSFDGYFLPLVSDAPVFDPATEIAEKGPLQAEVENDVPVRVRQTWTVRLLTQGELDAKSDLSEIAALLSSDLDEIRTHRQTLTNQSTQNEHNRATRDYARVIMRLIKAIDQLT